MSPGSPSRAPALSRPSSASSSKSSRSSESKTRTPKAVLEDVHVSHRTQASIFRDYLTSIPIQAPPPCLLSLSSTARNASLARRLAGCLLHDGGIMAKLPAPKPDETPRERSYPASWRLRSKCRGIDCRVLKFLLLIRRRWDSGESAARTPALPSQSKDPQTPLGSLRRRCNISIETPVTRVTGSMQTESRTKLGRTWRDWRSAYSLFVRYGQGRVVAISAFRNRKLP